MSRAVRITVGAVVAGTLAFVALVAGVMTSVGGVAGNGFFDELGTESLDTVATAEVLDVDDDVDWPSVDVRWTTPDGEVVVTYVDWEWTDALPEVGDDVEVVYDSTDPEWAFAADDPFVDSAPAASGGQDGSAEADPAADGLGRTAGWVSLAALLGLVVTVVLTVVAALRAPASPEPGAPPPAGPYGPGSVGYRYPPAPSHPPSQPYPSAHPYPPVALRDVRPAPPGPSGGDGWSAP